jgi:hypothetical protein
MSFFDAIVAIAIAVAKAVKVRIKPGQDVKPL